jgi:hypothetical protein
MDLLNNLKTKNIEKCFFCIKWGFPLKYQILQFIDLQDLVCL